MAYSNKEIYSAINAVKRDIINKVDAKVEKAVEEYYETLKEKVAASVSKEVRDMDMDELKKDVVEKAKESIIEEFDSNLDDITNEYKNNLNNMSKIYNSLSDRLSSQNVNVQNPKTI